MGLGLLTVAASAQSTTPTMRFLPLLSGYNVFVPTNATTIGLGVTNVLFTTTAGQVLFSLTNNYIAASSGTAVLNTNLTVGDAFKIVSLTADANGDINANTSLWISYGNTNAIPIVATNSAGQWFVTNWLYAVSIVPNWMYPATTNYYQQFIAGAMTNTITVTLYRAATLNPMGSLGASLGPNVPLWETTNAWNFTFVPSAGVTGGTLSTNLPTTWLQGAKFVYMTISAAAGGGVGGGELLNQAGIMQPQP